MARIARVVIPGCPHHIVHRGNRGTPVFLVPEHRAVYRRWLQHYAQEHGVRLWGYCLMTNHVHLIAVPEHEESLALGIGHAHHRYAQWINARENWRGHLWAGRYYSVPMDTDHLWRAVRYVETNPVRAGLVAQAQDYPYSSAGAHASGRPDPLLAPDRPFPDPAAVGDWATWLSQGVEDDFLDLIRRRTSSGWPLGSEAFVKGLEEQTSRRLVPRPRGRPW